MGEIFGTLFGKIIALLGLVVVVGVLYLAFASDKTTKATSDITLLATNAQALYNAQATFTSLTNTVAVSGQLAPKTMISGASTLTNPWGGSVTINVNAGNAAQFDITDTTIPAEACSKMLTTLSNLVALKVNGTAVTLPIDAGAATVSCNSPLANTLILTFAH
ncbi:type 4 pilus major pilin [Methylotenera sp.]|uniref:type 4 pilus major pilin n=1 Tax=Methylotenera sp. TaxID=2051956 RepID=UPI002EDA86E8